MSYCVNCGVELAASEEKCPLCGVPVINPAEPKKDNVPHPYPQHLETLQSRIDRRYAAGLIALILLIPVAVCLFTDAITGGGLSWSAYVSGACAMLFVWGVFPFLFKKQPKLVWCLLIDGAAALLYLLLIEYLVDGDWFLRLAMPISLAATLLLSGLSLLLPANKRLGVLLRTGFSLIAIGIFVVLVELFIDSYTASITVSWWSAYAFIPCVVLGCICFLLNRRTQFKEQIRRRFFI